MAKRLKLVGAAGDGPLYVFDEAPDDDEDFDMHRDDMGKLRAHLRAAHEMVEDAVAASTGGAAKFSFAEVRGHLRAADALLGGAALPARNAADEVDHRRDFAPAGADSALRTNFDAIFGTEGLRRGAALSNGFCVTGAQRPEVPFPAPRADLAMDSDDAPDFDSMFLGKKGR